MPHKVTQLISETYKLAECPTWDDRANRLLWTDIEGQTIQSMDWESREIKSWTFENQVGSFGLTEDDRWVVALWDKVFLFNPETHEREVLTEIEPHLSYTRLNDGKVGPDGAFWVGTLDTRAPREAVGALYRVSSDRTLDQIREGIKCSNGLAWAPNGDYMYHSDTSPGWIERYTFDPSTGVPGAKMLFAQQNNEMGRPDGATIDADGNYWSAGVSAGLLNCFSEDGSVNETIKLPVSRPTMPCFCGPNLDQLVVTSLIGDKNNTDGLDGGLFHIENHGQKGLKTYRFKV